MALRGNLRDFTLPDVFSLVTLSKKTGVLRIKREDGAEGSVWFRDGEVFFAQSNWNREPLGQRLVESGRVTPSALARCLDLQRTEPEGGRRLGRILVDEGYINANVLEAFVQEQIQDTIFDLMRWEEGDFDFTQLKDAEAEDIGLSVSIENIVMEGARRLEEWNRIKKKVPSMDMVFKMATAPGEGTFEISLKPVEWNLLLLVDGTRSVADLARDTGRTDFDVARVIYGLFSAGLLEVPTDEEVTRLRAERAEREARAPRPARRTEPVEAVAERPEAAPEPEQPAPATTTPPATAPAAAASEPAPAASEPAPAPAAPAAPATPEPAAEPGEEPEFLTAKPAPSPDDLAVFEQMMGVLEAPAPAVAEEAETETPPTPELEQEGEWVQLGETLPPEPILEEPPLEVTPPEPVPPMETAPEVVAEIPAPPAVTDELLEPDFNEPLGEEMFEPLGQAAPPVVEAPTPEPAVEPLPEPTPEPALETLLPDEPSADVSEPTELLVPEEPAVEVLLTQEPPEEIALPEEPRLEPSAVVPQPELEKDDGSLSDLLLSLEQEEAEALAASDAAVEPPSQPRIQSSESYGEYEEPSEEETQVISTDAFLAEFDEPMDVGLASGIGDELTALTGVNGAARGRPATSVNRIPEKGSGSGRLHRDQTVDRDLVMRIIQGIERL